jgi:DNA modification methylase
VEELTRITKKAGYMFNSSTKMQEMLRRYPEIKRVLIWGKQPSNYSFKYEPIFVWQFGRFKVNKYLFKDFWTMPPILGNENTYENPTKLYKEIMQMLPKGRVIDPFSGTGTTLRACRILNMDFIGVEIEKKKPVFDRGLLRFMEV